MSAFARLILSGRSFLVAALIAALCAGTWSTANAAQRASSSTSAAGKTGGKGHGGQIQSHANENVPDDPKLPRVLLIGDTISSGYAPFVQLKLKGAANVHTIGVNGGSTVNGLDGLKGWLGTNHWDVIVFNWGLHDVVADTGKNQVPLSQYEGNLRRLVKQLKATHAQLVWCSSTPVPSGDVSPKRKDSDVLAYNAAAQKIMDDSKIMSVDLYGYMLFKLSEYQVPKSSRFSRDGYEFLATHVASGIQDVLPLVEKQPAPPVVKKSGE